MQHHHHHHLAKPDDTVKNNNERKHEASASVEEKGGTPEVSIEAVPVTSVVRHKTPSQTTITFTDPPKDNSAVTVPITQSVIKVQSELRINKPKMVVTRIYGVTSQTAFGDQMYKYFLVKLLPYITEHFDDPILQEIIGSLREQVNKDIQPPNLPRIAAPDQSKEDIISSICEFVNRRAEINRTNPDSKAARAVIPAYIQLKSLIFRSGIHAKDIVSHVYEDAAAAFKVWSDAEIKLYSLSSGTNDVQADYFAMSNQGNLEQYFSGHISTVNPQVSSGESARVDFRALAKKIIQEETSNIVFLTDKLFEGKSAVKTDMTVILVSRDLKLGHDTLTEIKEETEIPVVSSFTSIIFTWNTLWCQHRLRDLRRNIHLDKDVLKQ